VTNNPAQGRIERTLAAILARPLWLRSRNMAAVWKLIGEPNAGVPDRQVLLRGIDLGDALIDGDDILGDGVNIVARLESMASRPNFSIAAYLDGFLRKQAQTRPD
jgi:class 3 adenylate cyclase